MGPTWIHFGHHALILPILDPFAHACWEHQIGRSCPKESRQICDRRQSLHQQRHWHDREPFLGNTPAQKTAGKSHNDVPYRTRHGSYTSLSTPPATRCCNKRPPVEVQSPIQQDQDIHIILLPVKHQTVEPAARRTDNR